MEYGLFTTKPWFFHKIRSIRFSAFYYVFCSILNIFSVEEIFSIENELLKEEKNQFLPSALGFNISNFVWKNWINTFEIKFARKFSKPIEPIPYADVFWLFYKI